MAEFEDDPRRKQFATLLALGMKPSAAYEKSGFRPDPGHSNGPKLAKDPRIIAMVEQIQQADAARVFDAGTLPGADALRLLMQEARAAENFPSAVTAARALAEKDGSLAALAPDDEMPDSEMARRLVPSYKTFLRALGLPVPTDDRITHAALCAMGNAGALGFTDGHGKPIPIDNPNKRNGGAH